MNNGLTIIIPIFNAENRIGKCLDSIFLDNLHNIEVIAIDDGSTDSTKIILQKYEFKYDNLKCIYKNNEGVSISRNIGIKNAKYDNIMFVDADDTVNICEFKYFFNFLDGNNNFELIQFQYKVIDLSAKSNTVYCNNIMDVNMNDFISSVIGWTKNQDKYGPYIRAVWGKVFKKEIIDTYKISFQSDLKLGEDAVFLLDYLKKINDITFLNGVVYNYFIFSNSTVGMYKRDLYNQCNIQKEKIISRFSNEDYYIDALFVFIYTCFFDLIENDEKSKKKGISSKDSLKWFVLNKKILCNKKINTSNMRKMIRIQNKLPMSFPIRYRIFLYKLLRKKER